MGKGYFWLAVQICFIHYNYTLESMVNNSAIEDWYQLCFPSSKTMLTCREVLTVSLLPGQPHMYLNVFCGQSGCMGKVVKGSAIPVVRW